MGNLALFTTHEIICDTGIFQQPCLMAKSGQTTSNKLNVPERDHNAIMTAERVIYFSRMHSLNPIKSDFDYYYECTRIDINHAHHLLGDADDINHNAVYWWKDISPIYYVTTRNYRGAHTVCKHLIVVPHYYLYKTIGNDCGAELFEYSPADCVRHVSSHNFNNRSDIKNLHDNVQIWCDRYHPGC